MINGISMIGKRKIILFVSQQHILKQVHSNCMDIEKMRLSVRELVYWVDINADIKNIITWCASCLEYQDITTGEDNPI